LAQVQGPRHSSLPDCYAPHNTMASGPPSDNLFITGLPEGFDEASMGAIFGAYGSITQSKLLTPQPGRKCAGMIRFSSVDEAKWIVDNLNGNIPQGLAEAIEVKYAMSKDQKGMMGKGCGAGPYGMDKGGGDAGKGKGKCSIRTLVKGLQDAGALPSGQNQNDSNTLFVAGLPFDTTDCDLFKMFTAFGPLKGVRAMVDPESGMCKGIGFVNMMDPTATQTAIATLNGTMLPDGTWLTVSIKTDGAKGKGDGKGKPQW